MDVTARRIRSIFEKIRGKAPDAILIWNGPHTDLTFFYITGLESGVFEDGVLLAYPNGGAVLYTSRLEEESARRGAGHFEIIVFDGAAELEDRLRKSASGVGRIGVNARELSYRSLLRLRRILSGLRIRDVGEAIAAARLVKDAEEIGRLRRAAEITSRAWEAVPQMLREGVTEGEVRAEICHRILKEGASLAFDPIVAFGDGSAEPHHIGGEESLKRGDLALFDFGARHRRYCADLTRTVIFGRASAEQRLMYEAVAEASDVGLDLVEAGAVAGEVHRRVSEVIDRRGFGGRFVHSTGHSLGLSVHDGARIGASSRLVLEEGMVFTVEPGVYVPEVGGVRIEDDVVVRRGGCEILTSSGRELLEL